MEHPVLAATLRTESGKGAAGRLRHAKKVPAIFYGPGIQPMMLTVEHEDLRRLTQKGKGDNILLDLQIRDGEETRTRKAMLKDMQIRPGDDLIVHADFYEISMDREITVRVPLRFVNTPVGIANGGILEAVTREITISCLPGKMQEILEVDVRALDLGDSLHVRDIVFPEGITPVDPEHLTLVVVKVPSSGEAKKTAEPEDEAAE